MHIEILFTEVVVTLWLGAPLHKISADWYPTHFHFQGSLARRTIDCAKKTDQVAKKQTTRLAPTKVDQEDSPRSVSLQLKALHRCPGTRILALNPPPAVRRVGHLSPMSCRNPTLRQTMEYLDHPHAGLQDNMPLQTKQGNMLHLGAGALAEMMKKHKDQLKKLRARRGAAQLEQVGQ